ncbi:MAG: DEAD/DEAH box helicase [Bacteroidota bacterium]|nr:DEAD/DEAH box helicase [Bacteroidota bacterium]
MDKTLDDMPVERGENTAPPETSPAPPLFSFDDLSPDLRERVAAMGWVRPTPVQQQAIPLLQRGGDLIVQAKTGSGKTGAYLLPAVNAIDPAKAWTQVLVLVPTRELARQVYDVFLRLTEGTEVRGALVYGGVGYGEQTRALREGAHLVVGTPGRILDHVYRGTFTVGRVELLVIDEADELLSMGFYPALRKLRIQLPEERQTCLLSATIPYHVEELARSFLKDPERLILSKGEETVSTLEHYYYIVPPLQKERALINLLEMENPDTAIIFCNTKRDVEYVAEVLKNNGYDALHLTGDMPQNTRERTVKRMHEGTLRFIVATDVLARGIDISDLSHVFLYSIPEQVSVYIHRSGRTARAGKTGIAITLCEDIEEKRLLGIARQYHFEIVKRPLPTPEEVAARTGERLLVQMETEMLTLGLMDRERLQRFLPLAQSLASTEEGFQLIALLLDRAYIQGLHRPLFQPDRPPLHAVPKTEGQSPRPRRRGRRKT